MKPLCVDLFAGLGGWTEGYSVVGFDIAKIPFELASYIARVYRNPISHPVGNVSSGTQLSYSIEGGMLPSRAPSVCSIQARGGALSPSPLDRSEKSIIG
jgi:hypothetical protein